MTNLPPPVAFSWDDQGFRYLLQTQLRQPHKLAGVLLTSGVILAMTGWSGVLAGALLVGALLAFAVATAKEPPHGLVGVLVVIYLLPFATSPLLIGPYHPGFLDITLSLLLATWLLKHALNRQIPLITPLGFFVLLFLAVATLALVLNLAYLSPERFRLFLKLVNGALLFFTAINVVTSIDALHKVVRGLMVAAGLAAGIPVLFWVLPVSISAPLLGSLNVLGYPPAPESVRYIADTFTVRANGTAIDPNLLGGMLAVALPLLLTQALSTQPLLRRRYIVLIALVLGLALLLTYSRTAWSGALVGTLFLAAMRYRLLWAPIIALPVLLAIAPQGTAMLERFWVGVTFSDRSAEMRLGEYQDALRLIERYPTLGVGFGSAPDSDLYVGVSSGYLLLAEQVGLIGLGVFLITMAVFFKTAWGYWKRRRHRWNGELMLGACGGVLVALSVAVFDHYFFNLQFPAAVALFWFMIGLTVAASRIEAGES